MKWKTFVVSVGSFAFLPAVAAANTMTFNASQWNTLIQSTSANNQLTTGLGDIYVGRTAQDGTGLSSSTATTSIRRGLIEFNVAGSGIPADATITGGSLTLCDVQGSNGSQTISLYDVLQTWGQGTSNGNAMGVPPSNHDATWIYSIYNTSAPLFGSTWLTPGGNFSATLSGSAVDNVAAGGLVTWSSAQIVNDIQNWLDNPSSNYGWLLQGNESTGKTTKQFEGSALNDSFAYAPLLTVQYTVPAPEPATAALLAAGMALAGGWRVMRFKRRA
jgi:hypothetical protein